MKLIWCSGFPEIYWLIGGGGGVNLPWVYVHSAIYETFFVSWFSRDLCSIGGGGGVNLPWVYVHCAIYETYVVSWFSRDLCSIGGGGGSICHRDMCIVQYIYIYICGIYVVYWFSRDLYFIGEGWDQSDMGICTIYICNLFGIIVFQRSLLDCVCGRVDLPADLASQYSRHLCLLDGFGG